MCVEVRTISARHVSPGVQTLVIMLGDHAFLYLLSHLDGSLLPGFNGSLQPVLVFGEVLLRNLALTLIGY